MRKGNAKVYGVSSDDTSQQSDRFTELLVKIGERLYNPVKIIIIAVVVSEIISVAIIYLFCEYYLGEHNLSSYLITITIAFACSFSISVLLVFIIKKFTDLVQRQKAVIEEEKKKSDRLLLNVLPYRIVDNLKVSGESKPELFNNVTVFFSDFVGFTTLASETGPEELISELNEIFTRFDEIMQKNGCERIKTIGDAFLSVCGMPDPVPDHAERMVNAAREIITYLKERNNDSRLIWQVRIGIHSGPVVGGIVGIHKYIYDIFGDSVNTASRMESISEPMKINISEITYSLVKDKFSFIEKPEVEVKGKGLMKTYFID
jgi:class 3 adenylate cyclase